mmetsp:Transcript_45656/g.76096  ORF Transcript_45656/g.76096 Transcript_45656/m.76096 type:complete len:225 (+) Transcript_45656:233-907(+)
MSIAVLPKTLTLTSAPASTSTRRLAMSSFSTAHIGNVNPNWESRTPRSAPFSANRLRHSAFWLFLSRGPGHTAKRAAVVPFFVDMFISAPSFTSAWSTSKSLLSAAHINFVCPRLSWAFISDSGTIASSTCTALALRASHHHLSQLAFCSVGFSLIVKSPTQSAIASLMPSWPPDACTTLVFPRGLTPLNPTLPVHMHGAEARFDRVGQVQPPRETRELRRKVR